MIISIRETKSESRKPHTEVENFENPKDPPTKSRRLSESRNHSDDHDEASKVMHSSM